MVGTPKKLKKYGFLRLYSAFNMFLHTILALQNGFPEKNVSNLTKKGLLE